MLLNEVANQLLKHAIKEPRPMLREGEKMWSPYGMPSAHSQFMWFLCVFAVLWLERRVILRERFPVAASLVKRAEQLGWVALASVVCYGRIYLRYHTATQVLVGAGVGAALGAVWFALCHWLLVPHLFPMIERWPVARMLLIKDSSSVPDVLHFEYQVWKQTSFNGLSAAAAPDFVRLAGCHAAPVHPAASVKAQKIGVI